MISDSELLARVVVELDGEKFYSEERHDGNWACGSCFLSFVAKVGDTCENCGAYVVEAYRPDVVTRAELLEVLEIVRSVMAIVKWGDYTSVGTAVVNIERRAAALAKRMKP